MGSVRRGLGMALAAMTWLAPGGAHAQTAGADPVPGGESALLAALREAERDAERATPGASTVAQGAAMAGTSLAGSGLDAEFAARLQLPAVTVRVSPRIVRALGLYRGDARARRSLATWLRLASRYRARIEARLVAEGAPPELVWVVAAESGFDPQAASSAGAVGLWQFVPEAARTYGLRVDTWVDERRDPERATIAAARYLRDLYVRFGTWELALAAYNMGYNALLRSIRKYNTNDFDALADMEAGLPWETVHYVPRVLALAVAARNESLFDLPRGAPDPVVVWDDVEVGASVPLADLAREARVDDARLRALNPALLRARTPVTEAGAPFVLHVPPGARDAVTAALARLRPAATRVYVLRHGETADDVAADYGMDPRALLRLSGLREAGDLRPGEQLVTPDREPAGADPDVVPVIAVDGAVQPPPGTRRVFYRVARREDALDVARALGVRRDDLVAWNTLDRAARLQPGMWLQAFVATTPANARVWEERQVEVVRRGSEEFHDRAVAATGRVRVRVTVAEGDTLESVARRYGATVGQLARINRRNRRDPLAPGQSLIVYTDEARARAATAPPPEPSP